MSTLSHNTKPASLTLQVVSQNRQKQEVFAETTWMYLRRF